MHGNLCALSQASPRKTKVQLFVELVPARSYDHSRAKIMLSSQNMTSRHAKTKEIGSTYSHAEAWPNRGSLYSRRSTTLAAGKKVGAEREGTVAMAGYYYLRDPARRDGWRAGRKALEGGRACVT